jgi:hypothetical protein
VLVTRIVEPFFASRDHPQIALSAATGRTFPWRRTRVAIRRLAVLHKLTGERNRSCGKSGDFLRRFAGFLIIRAAGDRCGDHRGLHRVCSTTQ